MKNLKVNLLAVIILLIAASCTTQRKFNRIADNHKDWLADKCAEEFPLKPSSTTTVTETKPALNTDWSHTIDSLRNALIQAENSVRIDTIYSKEDCNEKLQQQARSIRSLTASVVQWRERYEKCKPDTVIFTNTITVPDSALVYSLKAKISANDKEIVKLEDDLEEAEKTRNWAIGILAALVLVAGVLKFIRVI